MNWTIYCILFTCYALFCICIMVYSGIKRTETNFACVASMLSGGWILGASQAHPFRAIWLVVPIMLVIYFTRTARSDTPGSNGDAIRRDSKGSLR